MVVVAQCGFVNGVNPCFWGLGYFFYKGHGRNGEVYHLKFPDSAKGLWFVVVVLGLGVLFGFLETHISTYLIA